MAGAFNITREAQLRSQDAQALVDGTAKYLADSAEVRGRVESLLEVSLRDFNASLDSNMEELRKLDADVIALSDKITDINTMVRGLSDLV